MSRTSQTSRLIDIRCTIVRETGKAWLVDDGTRQVWVAKSQAEYDVDSETLTLPEWLAIDKELV